MNVLNIRMLMSEERFHKHEDGQNRNDPFWPAGKIG